MVHQEGLLLGMFTGEGAVHPLCFQHEITASLLCFPTHPCLKDFLGENHGKQFWPLCLLLPGKGVSSTEKGGISTSCKHKGDLDQPIIEHLMFPHTVILEREHLPNYVPFLSAQHGATTQGWISIATYKASTAFSASAMICLQPCFNCACVGCKRISNKLFKAFSLSQKPAQTETPNTNTNSLTVKSNPPVHCQT